jgi:hypothetical protein
LKDALCSLVCCILQALFYTLSSLWLLLPLAALSLLFLLSLPLSTIRTQNLYLLLATTTLREALLFITVNNNIRRLCVLLLLLLLLLKGVSDLRKLCVEEVIQMLSRSVIDRILLEWCERKVLIKLLLMTMRVAVKFEFVAKNSVLRVMWCLLLFLSGTATDQTGIVGRVIHLDILLTIQDWCITCIQGKSSRIL